MPSLEIWTRREVCDSKSHVYGMAISSRRKGCLMRALGKEELCALADGRPVAHGPPEGGCVLDQADIKVMDSRPLG